MATFRGGNPNVVAWAGWRQPFDKVLYWLFHSHHGVYVFFLLSGFLIAKIASGEGFSYCRFVRNRMLRIYPAFLLALVLCLAAGPLLGIPLPSLRDFVFNLLFLNGVPTLGVTGIVFNNVSWSLFYEMVFYLSFPLVLTVGRLLRLPAIAATALAGVVFAYGPALAGMYFEFFVFLFAGAIVGLLAPSGLRAVAVTFPDFVVVLLYCIATSMMTTGYLNTAQFVWLFAGLGALLLCKAVDGEGWFARTLAWRPLAALGRISYSFYLLHSVALAALFALWWHLAIPALGDAVNVVYLGIVGFAGAVGIGLVSFRLAEQFYFRRRQAVPVSAAFPVDASAQSVA
ncbi:peptidoglycan/LPS O-acetylase OafA/YrhL [Bradyrhizobium sp. CIR48]|nr:peptidoglycan/LPS O-acetylase OafA/YrhL [Bradyrhizobium sp. CIR48]